jgi:hypothetical protein
MGYSVRIPLGFGRLKIKSESRLRTKERAKEVPTWRFGNTWIVWESYDQKRNDTNHPSKTD